MNKKKINNASSLVYSTDPDFKIQDDEPSDIITLSNNKQKLKVKLDKQHRAGKVVTLIIGFEGNGNDIEDLAKKIKSFCGTGGSVKDGEIIIQGNNTDKIMQWLVKNGYSNTKKI